MKMSINQVVLIEALEKGASASLSEAAQADSTNLSPIIQSAKITIGNKFTVESATSLFASNFSIDATEENGITVKEEGCILIPAKEFIEWVKIQGFESEIDIALFKLATPEIINPMGDDDSNENTITKIGSVRFVSKDKSKTSGKWELNSYDPQFSMCIDFKEKENATEHFKMEASNFITSIGKVAFSSLKKDSEGLLNNVSIQHYKDNLYLLATDTKRCALCKMPVDKIDCQDPLLIPTSELDQASKILNKEEKISIAYSKEKDRIYLSQSFLQIRMASANKENIKKFPTASKLFEHPYTSLATVSKGSLNRILVSAAMVNCYSALFSFQKDESLMAIKAISEEGKYKPSISKAKAITLSEDKKVIWGVNHLIEGLKILKDDVINLFVPSNMKSLRITCEGDDSFQYFVMALVNSKYDSVE